MAEADRAGQGSSDFRAFLRDLPDEIALARERGLPVELVVDAPLAPHAQRLMDTLGVPVEVRPVTRTQSHADVAAGARSEGHYVQVIHDSNGNGGGPQADWIGFRASVSSAYQRRHDLGETVETCDDCGTETDVDDVVHSPKCKLLTGAAKGAADWDQDAVIAAFQAYARDHDGFPPPVADWTTRGADHPSYGVVARLFGTWAAGVRAAGLEPLKRGQRRKGANAIAAPEATAPETPPVAAGTSRNRKWTRDAIIASVQRWVELHGERPMSTDWLQPTGGEWPQTSAVQREFGSWNKGMEACGFATRHGGPRKRSTTRRTSTAQAPRQEPPIVWAVKVAGTGLRYRTVDEALVAADEIEHEGERVAREARVAGDDGKADQAIDASRELAEKIRAACNPHAENIPPALPEPVVEPHDDLPANADRIRETPASLSLDLIASGDTNEWIAKLTAEANWLERRADACRTIADGLRQLQETER